MAKTKKDTVSHSSQLTSLQKQIEDLEQRSAEAEDALDAIRRGAVDALVISGEEGDKIYTIQGADTPYRLLVEAINEGTATLIEDGTILYCNRHLADMVKTPLQELIGTSIFDRIAPENRASFSSLIHRGLHEECREELDLLIKGGGRIPVLVSMNSFSAFGGAGVCLVASDLTERKKMEELTRLDAQLAETLSDYSRSLVEASLDEQILTKLALRSSIQLIGDICVIRLISPDGLWLKVAAHYHPDPETDHYLGDFNQDVTLKSDEGLSGQVIQTGQPMLIPVVKTSQLKKFLRPELLAVAKKLKASSLMVVPLRTQQKTIGSMVLARLPGGQPYTQKNLGLAQRIANQAALAITNARLYNDLQTALQMEQNMRQQLIQAEKLSSLSRMLTTVVHEINNPVQTIKNCVYLALLDAPVGSSLEAILTMASSEIDRISNLVAGLREIYRQPKSLIKEPLELSKLLADVHMLLEPHLLHKKIIWQQLPTSKTYWIFATADHIKQVLLNISLNAIDAMQPVGGTITITTRADTTKNEVGVAITDTGCGIECEDLDKIFEPFYTTKEEGSGLGLPICYEIVQQYAGRITVESQPGAGSTFTVWLPQTTPAVV